MFSVKRMVQGPAFAKLVASRLSVVAAISFLSQVGCASKASTEEVAYDAVGDVVIEPGLTSGTWTIEVTEAQLAFGPAYFCAANFGSATLCEVAVGELRRDVLLPALAGEFPLGRVEGVTGAVRSASFDFGIHWFPTQSTATPSEVAPEGHSFVATGAFVRETARVPFRLEVDAAPQYAGQRYIPTRAVSADVTTKTTSVHARFEVGAWLSSLPVDELVAASAGQPITIAKGSSAHNAVLIAMTVTHPVSFEWRE